MSYTTYIGMGSNLGESREILRSAVEQLKQLGQVRVSRLYESPPMGPQDQPHYLNAVAQLETTLSPLELLDHLQQFEQDAGRVRLRRWGERTLDLDLLLYADQEIQHERLMVPHVGLLERDFVVVPLLDLNKNLVVKGQYLNELKLAQAPSLTVLAASDWAE
ncbi:2-amino-4-hydroxy-6-hydroxymethyldihydropteridine diphosphokinase [Acinetobacter soli]|uniref:2-amino-4-hydroxy-6- hydroxymethyldihydropteridine diphosphokinase n=1 Tax=Acinetobacter soli TaxID=487316 RepID=UPI001C453383|nr:2-amino-4-hydroxy-6-hydroxymethyldihydropteridine diphosphokinase [Acinetobacter soli]MBV6551805.1 2-amino-4-hydroxy-6-hydroxymethyldihydropteridine diphosphokinase [Acinetobacter soli]